jgi:hypothetical protein
LGWYTFIGPDGEFSLAFPAKPERSNSDAEGPVTSIRQYQVSAKAGNHFSINRQDVGETRHPAMLMSLAGKMKS